MGLFDSYFDPQQFEDGGGLLGRMLSLQQQQGQYQPGEGFGVPYGQAPERANTAEGAASPPAAWQTPDYGQTQNIRIGSYQMAQFGRPEPPQAAPQPPDLSDRLGAGFQSWAHTPVGNPFCRARQRHYRIDLGPARCSGRDSAKVAIATGGVRVGSWRSECVAREHRPLCQKQAVVARAAERCSAASKYRQSTMEVWIWRLNSIPI
jgi:hypothetical protein